MKKRLIKSQKGVSLIELMLAMAVFVVGIASIAHLFIGARTSLNYSLEKSQALFLAKEGIEEKRFSRFADFNNLTAGTTSDTVTLNGTSFNRNVDVSFPISWEAEVTSTVSWDSLSGQESVTLIERFIDWSPSFACGDNLDYQGYSYSTVEIGTQCWFAEDLRYDDGCGANTWNDEEPYNACDTQGTGYDGLLYQWGAAMDEATAEEYQGLCPDGWHVPTHDEWTDLERYVCNAAGNSDCETAFPKDTTTYFWRGTDEGDRLKSEPAVDDWCNGATCENLHGFTALPGGTRSALGGHTGGLGDWWTSTDEGNLSWHRALNSSNSSIYREDGNRANGRSVRCLKDQS